MYRYISETVQDRHIVTMEANKNSYVLYRLVLFPVTLSNRNYPMQTIPFSTFCVAFHIFVVSEVRNFKFGK